MPFMLVPKDVRSRRATVWLGVANENTDLNSLELRCNGAPAALGTWRTYRTESGKNTLHYQSVEAPDAQPKTDYVFELFQNNTPVTVARTRTLPDDLPSLGEDPFTVLLASCFCSRRSESASLGGSYLNLQKQQRTDIKILCGDQVYLDDPALDFSLNKHDRRKLEDKLLANYLRTWTQSGSMVGYRQFLQNGANFFSSDDHEFWNNAPRKTPLVRDSHTQAGRYAWMQIAGNLLKIFQSESTVTRFEVGPLSFFIADTRVNRDGDGQRFMSDADLNELRLWVNNLRGVGVLVVGQPIFTEKGGFIDRRLDLGFPDYEQYADFVRILHETNHSILLLTGDVHFGRIAHCQLKSNVYLYEIISSPTALVHWTVGGKWSEAPDRFPSFGVPGVAPQRITTDPNFKFTQNHFMTLDFYRAGGGARVVVKAYEIFKDGRLPAPVRVAELNLR